MSKFTASPYISDLLQAPDKASAKVLLDVGVESPTKTTVTGNGVLTTFAIVGASGLTNPNVLNVAIDGIVQEPGVDYTVSGGNIIFTDPLPNGSKAVIIRNSSVAQITEGVPSDGSVTSAKLAPNLTLINPTLSGTAAFTGSARPTSSGTGAPAANSLITREDGDARFASQSNLNSVAPGLTGNIRVVLEGDSITQGVTSGGATAGNMLQDRLALESYFAGRTTFFNVATQGNNTANVVSQYASEVFPLRPSANGNVRTILLLNIGTNDANDVATQNNIAAQILTYCATARADGFEVWLCTPLPRNVNPEYKPYLCAALRDGEGYDKLINLNGLFNDTNGWTNDNLHPNNLGYRIIAAHINDRAHSRMIRDSDATGSMGRQNSDAIAVTGGTISGLSSCTVAGPMTRTSSGAGNAEYVSQALGAGGSRQWVFGHTPNTQNNVPQNGFTVSYFNGSSWEAGQAGYGPNGRVIGNQVTIVPRTVSALANLATVIGNKAIVTNALNPVVGSAVASGGARLAEVTYNGSSWIVVAILN